jgi:hypothetical protein
MSLLDFVRIINSTQNFKIHDDFKFVDFEDMTFETMDANVTLPTSMEIFAEIKISYDGEPPESYKALNLIIGDWVEKNVDSLSNVIHGKHKEHVDKNYPDSDTTDLNDEETTALWMDQLDYMPQINEDKKEIAIEIELVLHAEPLEEEKDD